MHVLLQTVPLQIALPPLQTARLQTVLLHDALLHVHRLCCLPRRLQRARAWKKRDEGKKGS